MTITVTSYEAGEEDSVESFAGIDALAGDLADTASSLYAGEVLDRLRSGETRFTVANGPGSWDTYEVTEDDA